MGGVVNKTIIPLSLVAGYETIIASSALRALLVIYHLIFNVHSWNNCYTLGNLPPGPDEGDSVPFDGVAGRPVVVGTGPVDGAVDPVGGLVDPGAVGPGRHWLMHPQRLFKLNVYQMIRIILVIYKV